MFSFVTLKHCFPFNFLSLYHPYPHKLAFFSAALALAKLGLIN